MAYTPKPIEQSIYTTETGDKLFKVISANPIEVVVVRLNKDNSEESAPLTWSEKQWNGKRLRSIEEPPPPPHEDKSFTFQYDEDGNLTIFQDGKPVKRLNIRGPEGKPGKDGMPGQDGAPGQKGQDGATGQPGKDGAPGEKGQDGAPGKDGAPGPEGKQGAPGPKGEDGVYWYPEISKDGTQLRFKNRNNSSEHTEWYDIKGPKGDTGGEGPRGIVGPAGPVFIPSVNSDGDLSWSNTGQGLTNPSTRNIKGDKGDKGDKGATFHPIVKDGVLYWYDDNGNLVKGITPARITGAQGKQGEQGAQGLSAYQIWLKQGYRGTEQDFLDSLKGEKGSPAPPASFSFKDVEDFTCKVQKIDTNLIVDKDDDTDSPEEIVDKKIEFINDLRKKGRRLGTFQYCVKNWFKEITWWCAGADRNLLRMCPGDHSKYVGIGTVIIFTALMAFFSSSIALNLVFEPEEGSEYSVKAVVFGVFWAFMIFFLDRFITNTMYSDGKVTISKQEFFSGLPRITIAIFLGIVISAPLELKIFQEAIDEKIEHDQRFAGLEDKNKVSEIKKGDYEKTQNKYQREIEQNENIIKTHRSALEQLNAQREALYKESTWSDEHGIHTSQTWKSRRDQTAWDKDNKPKLDTLNKQILQLSSRNVELTNKLSSELSQITNEEANYKDLIDSATLDNGLLVRLSKLHELAMDGYKPFLGGNSNTWLDYVLLHPLWYYLFFSPIGLIMLLFILIDVSPVLYKMMLADGNYDNYLHQEKLLAQDKIRLSLSNMLKKLNNSELKRVAPFIMGDVYEKMAGDSYIYKSEDDFKKEIAAQKGIHWFWRIWPFSMIRWFFWKEDDKPTAPVIVLNKKETTPNQKAVINANDEVFEEVLDMKKKIILASYRRWYKTQHDCIICDDVNDENKARDEFDDEAPQGDDSEIHIDDNDDPETVDNDPEGNNDSMDDNLDEETSKADDNDSEEINIEDSEPEPEEENVSEEDDDEQELPDDDGDDNPKK